MASHTEIVSCPRTPCTDFCPAVGSYNSGLVQQLWARTAAVDSYSSSSSSRVAIDALINPSDEEKCAHLSRATEDKVVLSFARDAGTIGAKRKMDSPKSERTRMYGSCKHGKRKQMCRECGGSGICQHGKQRHHCRECGGSGFCVHGKRKARCKECGGISICEHGRQKGCCRQGTAHTESEKSVPTDKNPVTGDTVTHPMLRLVPVAGLYSHLTVPGVMGSASAAPTI